MHLWRKSLYYIICVNVFPFLCQHVCAWAFFNWENGEFLLLHQVVREEGERHEISGLNSNAHESLAKTLMHAHKLIPALIHDGICIVSCMALFKRFCTCCWQESKTKDFVVTFCYVTVGVYGCWVFWDIYWWWFLLMERKVACTCSGLFLTFPLWSFRKFKWPRPTSWDLE